MTRWQPQIWTRRELEEPVREVFYHRDRLYRVMDDAFRSEHLSALELRLMRSLDIGNRMILSLYG